MRKLALLFLLLPLVAAGCHHGMRAEVKGSGKRVVQKRQISAFTSISTEGAFEIEVTCQKDPSLEVEGDENLRSIIDQLGSAPIGQRLRHLGERVEQCVLGSTICHLTCLLKESLDNLVAHCPIFK